MKNIYIYDSLNSKKLHKHHEQFFQKLFPTYNFNKNCVKFSIVQHQPNSDDCGVFAIVFAISLLFNIKSEKVKYNHSLMRPHLIKMFESGDVDMKRIQKINTKKKRRYNQNLENICDKDRNQYKQVCIKQSAKKRIRYSINIQCERDRQKRLDPDRKDFITNDITSKVKNLTKLCYKRNVYKVNNLQVQIDIKIWRDLMAYVQQQKINAKYICNHYAGKFRNNLMPAYCILNNLFTDDVPEVISSLNTFEKILIQRAKAFQTVFKMGTVINRKLPQRQMVQKETLNKLCSTTDPINDNRELYILFRDIPTKSKIIWEEIVNVKKVFDALTWLKQTENTEEMSLNDIPELLNDSIEEINNNIIEIILEDQQKAMLTQVTDERDGYYEQYTIYLLHKKKANKTADLPLDNREKYLDLMCFPDLYPFGINGQHETKVKLFDHKFIKCRLIFKHPQYRLNQQYLFYLLNNANIRQLLNRGIYHKMNVIDLYLGEYIREINGWHDNSLCVSVLVARDPILTSKFLNNKFRAILDFISSKDHSIGEVTHYFWRPAKNLIKRFRHYYIDVLIRINNIYITIIVFAPKKIGCKIICRCRFGFLRPVSETLNMRDVATSIAGRKQLKHKSRFYDFPFIVKIDFTMFLSRTDNEININDYNPVLLTAWEDNVDIQFIDEKSSLLTWYYYITKYMNKAGKSELSNIILESKNSKNKSLAKCGALEVADTLLDIPLYGTDRNTTIKSKIAKKLKVLMPTIDIFYPSLIDNHYPHRPNELENMSLYEFAQWYDISKIKPRNKNIEYYKIDNENLRNECDTYAKLFHKVKLHLAEALQYEKLELQKVFETTKELIQQCLDDNLQKQQSG
ncbi:hypothetical protein ACFW04_014313 [Cataglyphis niger]